MLSQNGSNSKLSIPMLYKIVYLSFGRLLLERKKIGLNVTTSCDTVV